MTIDPESVRDGYPPHRETHVSEDEPQLAAFISALGMQRPVPADKAALLLGHIVKDQMSSDAASIADQMRTDHWENDLSDGETLNVLAERAFSHLGTHEGINLFNFFAKTVAKTSPPMP